MIFDHQRMSESVWRCGFLDVQNNRTLWCWLENAVPNVLQSGIDDPWGVAGGYQQISNGSFSDVSKPIFASK